MAKVKINLDEIISKLRENKEVLKKYGVKKIGLFGSFVRGEQQRNSDIDFFVEFDEPDFDNFTRLYLFLENLFGRKVELLTSAGIESIRIDYIKEEIKRSIIYV